ncbi:hypothetical protein [Neorhizobium sp. NCHU2750]|uniref:hypothetical protein n=1 Tax=Neorhizobium sp. NCHU2750 TaxID=1825976 RepID=UPI000EB7572C|nr:hypothetical protein NCHU2750_27970 [Neorhizobium sp. NCHU2750]
MEIGISLSLSRPMGQGGGIAPPAGYSTLTGKQPDGSYITLTGKGPDGTTSPLTGKTAP